MPSWHEALYVLVGAVLGSLVTMVLVATAGHWLTFGILLTMAPLLPVGLLLINVVTHDRESRARLTELQREADDYRFWTTVANRAASNKRTQLGWTGRRRRRAG